MRKNNGLWLIVGFILSTASLHAQEYVPEEMKDLLKIPYDVEEHAIYSRFLEKFTVPSITIKDSTCKLMANKNAGERYYSIEFSGCQNIADGERASMYGWSEINGTEQPDGQRITYKNVFSERMQLDLCGHDVCTKVSTVYLNFLYNESNYKYPTGVDGKIDVIVYTHDIDPEDTPYLGGYPKTRNSASRSYSIEIK